VGNAGYARFCFSRAGRDARVAERQPIEKEREVGRGWAFDDCHFSMPGTQQLTKFRSNQWGKPGADTSGTLKWHVDASFAVHTNMRRHTGVGLMLGRGFPIISSIKQKLNTKSSTESKLIGVDDMIPSILLTRYFLKACVDNKIIFQDNHSAMLLERNGKASSTKRTKHINVRYFFITDRISKGEV
jgi:hypothetical protein